VAGPVSAGPTGGDVVREYFAACGQGDADHIAACFTPDAVLYDTNHPPVVGAEAIGRFWTSVAAPWGRRPLGGRHAAGGPGRCSHRVVMHGERRGRPFTAYGSDHYTLRGGRIAEVRQYWVLDRDRFDTGLVGYPYPD
jgi:ketosteroid isomerase-like protein